MSEDARGAVHGALTALALAPVYLTAVGPSLSSFRGGIPEFLLLLLLTRQDRTGRPIRRYTTGPTQDCPRGRECFRAFGDRLRTRPERRPPRFIKCPSFRVSPGFDRIRQYGKPKLGVPGGSRRPSRVRAAHEWRLRPGQTQEDTTDPPGGPTLTLRTADLSGAESASSCSCNFRPGVQWRREADILPAKCDGGPAYSPTIVHCF